VNDIHWSKRKIDVRENFYEKGTYCQKLSREENFAVAKNRDWANLIDFAGIKFRGWGRNYFLIIRLGIFFLFSRVEMSFYDFSGINFAVG